jgi:hypothetical protein
LALSIKMPVWRALSRTGIPAMRRDFLLRMMPKGAVCAEVGVWEGDFSDHILRITQPRELHLIDPWRCFDDNKHRDSEFGSATNMDQEKMDRRYDKVLKRFGSQIHDRTVVVHRATSEEASRGFEDRRFDWVYIDGDHVYDAVKKDLEMFHKKVKPGGIIAGDDYCESQNYQKDGVKRAVDEFIAAGKGKGMVVKRKQYFFRNV